MSRSRTVVLSVALVGLLVATALAGCLDPGSGTISTGAVEEPGFRGKVFDGYVHVSADIPVTDGAAGVDGVTVHADVWRPDPATYTGDDPEEADAPVPVIAVVSPYFNWKDGEDRRPGSYHIYDWLFEEMIPRGYAFAAVETPGTAGSSGCWDFMGPQEVAASAGAVEWLGAQEWSSGKVGMIGLSYDGMTQIMAASERPEALATIVPGAPLTHAYGGVYMAGVPYWGFWAGAQAAYTGLYGVAYAPAHTPERMPGYVKSLPANALCAPENLGYGVANDGDYNAYYEERDFRASAKELDIPVFFTQGFMDRNVRPDNAFPYVNDLQGSTMVWLGQWTHAWPNAEVAGRDDFYLTLHRWFDRWLKGEENGVESMLGVHVQDSEGRWRVEEAWPPADAAPRAFRLADGYLVEDADATGAGAAFVDDAQPFAEVGQPRAVNGPVPGEVVWDSAPLAADVHVAGTPLVSLNVSSSGARGFVVALLMACDGADAPRDLRGHGCTVVTRGGLNLLHRNGLEQGEPLTPGEVVDATFPLQPQDHVFREGQVIRLLVTGADADWFVPEWTRNVVTVHEDLDAPSTLTLPVVTRDADAFTFTGCGRALEGEACHDPDLEDRFPEDA